MKPTRCGAARSSKPAHQRQRYGGSNIEIRIVDGAGQVSLSVVDDGDGVPEEDAERIFDAYVRGHEAVLPARSASASPCPGISPT